MNWPKGLDDTVEEVRADPKVHEYRNALFARLAVVSDFSHPEVQTVFLQEIVVQLSNLNTTLGRIAELLAKEK